MNEQKPSSFSGSEDSIRIAIPEDLRGCHPLIRKTRQVLEKTTPWHIGSLLQTRQRGILSITVTRASLHRALRLMQALITLAEARGWRIKPSTDQKKFCAIKIGNDELGIRMKERIKRYEIPRGKEETTYSWNQYRYDPTGLLTLEVTDYVADATRSEWHEGKRQTLEEMLPEFVEGLAAAAEARVAWHLRLEESKRDWEKADARRHELERRTQREKLRRDTLLKQSRGYAEAADLRRFIAAFRAATLDGTSWSGDSRERWGSWAEKIADRLDPFLNCYFDRELADSEFEPQLKCSIVSNADSSD